MSVCPKKDECFLLSNVKLISVLKNRITSFYCQRNYGKCARYQLIEQSQPVPDTLLPNDKVCVTCQINNP